MTFSQIWDTGFRTVLLYAGVVFAWLGLVERYFESQSTSVIIMNIVALVISVAFVLLMRQRAIATRLKAEAEVAAVMQEDA